MATLSVNGRSHEIDADPSMPLLWVLRDLLELPGTKYGCGIAACGACTVHMDGQAVRSCSVPLSAAEGSEITTIEGLENGSLFEEAWVEAQAPQCGYCQVGQIMSAAALLASNPSPTDADIDQAMAGNLCRCGTYQRIKAAIHRAADAMGRTH